MGKRPASDEAKEVAGGTKPTKKSKVAKEGQGAEGNHAANDQAKGVAAAAKQTNTGKMTKQAQDLKGAANDQVKEVAAAAKQTNRSETTKEAQGSKGKRVANDDAKEVAAAAEQTKNSKKDDTKEDKNGNTVAENEATKKKPSRAVPKNKKNEAKKAEDGGTEGEGGRKTAKPSKEGEKIKEEQSDSKERQLLSMMMVYHMRGTKAVTYARLLQDLGYRPNNSAVDKAWKDVREMSFVEEAEAKEASGKKCLFQLTKKGIDEVAPEEYKSDLANPPKTTEELHERIKARAMNDSGRKIFELLLKKGPLTGKQLADMLKTREGSHPFFYAFKEHKDKGYVEVDKEATERSVGRKKKYRLSPEKTSVKADGSK